MDTRAWVLARAVFRVGVWVGERVLGFGLV